MFFNREFVMVLTEFIIECKRSDAVSPDRCKIPDIYLR